MTLSYRRCAATRLPVLLSVGLLVAAGLSFVGCDSSGSNDSGPSYEFDGVWRHAGGGRFGAGFEHYLDVGGGDVTKYEVSLDVDGNRIGCSKYTQAIEDYDAETGTVTLNGELDDDGPEIQIEVDGDQLTYTPEGGEADGYSAIGESPSDPQIEGCD